MSSLNSVQNILQRNSIIIIIIIIIIIKPLGFFVYICPHITFISSGLLLVFSELAVVVFCS